MVGRAGVRVRVPKTGMKGFKRLDAGTEGGTNWVGGSGGVGGGWRSLEVMVGAEGLVVVWADCMGEKLEWMSG